MSDKPSEDNTEKRIETANEENTSIESNGIVRGSEKGNTKKDNNQNEDDQKAPKVSKHALQKAQHRKQQRTDFTYCLSEAVCPTCAKDLVMSSLEANTIICTGCDFRFNTPPQQNGKV